MTTSIERVREVIAASGMSQGDFAAAVGLDAPKLSKSLSGTRRFSSLDVARIAEVGRVSVDWLLGADEPAVATAARRAAGSTSGIAMAAADRFAELRSVATELGFGLEARAVDVDVTGLSPRRGGETLADWAIKIIGDPLRILEPELAELVEAAFGVDVAITDLGDGFDGLGVITPDAKLILAAPTAVPARQRFTIAHELAHLLCGDDQEVHLDEDVFAPAGQDSGEVRANAFAAAFLMPAPLLADRVNAGFGQREFAGLAIDFKVSPQAMAIRLASLNLIDKLAETSFKRMTLKEAAKLTGRSSEVSALATRSSSMRPPKRLADDLFAAYTDGRTSLRPYASAVGADPRTLRDELEATAEG